MAFISRPLSIICFGGLNLIDHFPKESILYRLFLIVRTKAEANPASLFAHITGIAN